MAEKSEITQEKKGELVKFFPSFRVYWADTSLETELKERSRELGFGKYGAYIRYAMESEKSQALFFSLLKRIEALEEGLAVALAVEKPKNGTTTFGKGDD